MIEAQPVSDDDFTFLDEAGSLPVQIFCEVSWL
jgi:hypothetical protein